MAKKAGGEACLEAAKACLAKAKTVEKPRQAQAVVLPLEYGLSLKPTAQAIGVSVGWACHLRTRFARGEGVPGQGPRRRGGRRRVNMTPAQEAAFLAPFFETAKGGGASWSSSTSSRRWTRAWGAPWPWPLPITSCTVTVGASWRPTSDTPRPTWPLRRTGKKLASRLGQIDRQWQGDGPIRLMFQDEAHLGRLSDTRRCWCPKPIRPLCYAMVTQEYTYAYAAVSVADGQLDTLILPHVNGECMQVFLGEVAHHHPDERILRCSTAPACIRARRLVPAPNLRRLTLPPTSFPGGIAQEVRDALSSPRQATTAASAGAVISILVSATVSGMTPGPVRPSTGARPDRAGRQAPCGRRRQAATGRR